jgi:hypothetical protein
MKLHRSDHRSFFRRRGCIGTEHSTHSMADAAPTGAWFNDYRNDRAPSNMMFFRPPLAHILGEDRKRVLWFSVYDDCFSNGWILFLLHLED